MHLAAISETYVKVVRTARNTLNQDKIYKIDVHIYVYIEYKSYIKRLKMNVKRANSDNDISMHRTVPDVVQSI